MLGGAFSFAGETVSGKQLGRAIGVPTINLQVHPRKVLPAHGVYAARAIFDDDPTNQRNSHAVALSIGVNPTTESSDNIKVEFHVIGENIETPPKSARLEVVAWLREEEKFASLDELIIQMRHDIEAAKAMLA